MFSARTDPVTGEQEVCVVATELGYFQLEQNAQKRGKTVEQYLYGEMAHAFTARGLNVSPDSLYVTTEPPDEIDAGKPPVRRVILQ
jgi:hypothetical protein